MKAELPADAETAAPPLETYSSILTALETDLLAIVLGGLDAVSLVVASSSCLPFRQLESALSVSLWRQLVLSQWDWLVTAPPPGQTWRHFYVRLHSAQHTRFCVFGGGRPEGFAISLSLDAEHHSLSAFERSPNIAHAPLDGERHAMNGTEWYAA